MSNEPENTTEPCLDHREEPQSFLRIQTSEHEEHLLPLGHLLYARRGMLDDSEVIELFFAAHNVAILGANLRELFTSLRNLKARTIRTSPANPGEKAVWIKTIEVAARQSGEQ